MVLEESERIKGAWENRWKKFVGVQRGREGEREWESFPSLQVTNRSSEELAYFRMSSDFARGTRQQLYHFRLFSSLQNPTHIRDEEKSEWSEMEHHGNDVDDDKRRERIILYNQRNRNNERSSLIKKIFRLKELEQLWRRSTGSQQILLFA